MPKMDSRGSAATERMAAIDWRRPPIAGIRLTCANSRAAPASVPIATAAAPAANAMPCNDSWYSLFIARPVIIAALALKMAIPRAAIWSAKPFVASLLIPVKKLTNILEVLPAITPRA